MKKQISFLIIGITLILSSCAPAPSATPAPPTATPLPQPEGEHLLISEVMAGAEGNNLYDFIELYNPTGEIVDLKGFSLWYRLTEEDEETQVYLWLETTLVPPHGHYLIGQEGQDFGLAADLQVNQPLQPQRGGLILKNNARIITDSLGWGAAPESAVEGSPAAAMQNDVSLERNPGSPGGNFHDQNDNAIDFSLNPSPNPENSGSPLTPPAEASLTLTVAVADSISPGEQFDYYIQMSNKTAETAENATIQLTIPEALTIITAPEGALLDGQTISLTQPTLAPGKTVYSWITVEAPLLYSAVVTHSYYAQAKNFSLPTFGPPLTTRIEGGSIPIITARELIGQEVVVEGIATMYTGGLFAGSGAKFYLTDGTAGAQVYVAGAGNSLRVNIGDRVRVQGIVTPYRGAIEIAPSNEALVEIIEPKVETPTPAAVSIQEIAVNGDALKGDLVQVEGTFARVEEFNFSYEIDLVDTEGNLITAYLDKETGMTINTIVSGDRYQVTGIVEGLDNNILLYPRQQTDLVQVYPPIVMIEAKAPISIREEDPFEISFTVTNYTPQEVANLTVTAPLPTGAEVIEIGQGGELNGNLLTWQIDSLAGEGGQIDLTINLQAADGTKQLAIQGYQVIVPDLETITGSATYIFTSGIVPIWAIQGSGLRSPYPLQSLETEGIVTSVFPDLGGFWIQETVTDTDPNTSAGIFVHTGPLSHEAVPGDLVSVRGLVSESFQQTQLSISTLPQLSILSRGNDLPAPVALDPPSSESAAQTYYEALEGMLVSVTRPAVVVAPTNSYGEFSVVLGYHNRSRLYRGEDNGIVIMADDGSSIVHKDQSSLAYALSTGDRITDLAGPLSFTFGNYKIELMKAPTITPVATTLPTLPPLPENEFSLMTWNVENLFDIRDPHPSSPPLPTVSEYRLDIEKVTQTIVSAGLPTIIGLQEVENIDVLEDIADNELIRSYGYIPVLIEGSDSRGIDVGYLVRGDRAEVLTVEQYPAPEEITSRPPLLVKVRLIGSGTEIYVLNNHFTSMSGGESATEPRRNAQAAWNVTVKNQLLAEDPGALLAVIGDLNSFYNSLPIDTLREGRLLHTFDRLLPEQRYTYIYEGVSQTLDHILVTEELDALVSEVLPLHVNADYAIPPAGDGSPMHESDHDPVVVTFSIPLFP